MGPLRPTRPSESVAGYLARNEHVVLEMKQHWAQLLPALSSCLLGLVLVVVAGLSAPAWMGPVTNAAWWIWLVLLLHFVWRLFEWWDKTFVITNKRLILLHGLFFKKVAMMPLSKVTDMSYNRSPAARILGYGTFVIESAGQEQALNVIDYVSEPDSKYREICGLIFGVGDDEDHPSRHPHHSDEVFDPYRDENKTLPVRVRTRDTQFGTDERPDRTRGPVPRSSDETDPYGMVTFSRPLWADECDRAYGEFRDVGEESDDTDDDSAWSVSREHATAPQTIRRSRYADTPSTWRDGE